MDINIVPKRDYFRTESPCRCPKCRDSFTPEEMDPAIKYKFNQIREFLGVPLYMTSGKRCANHPVELEKFKKNGKYTGQHYFGKAADIRCDGAIGYKLMVCAIALGATGIAFGHKFIHIDFRSGDGMTWTY